MKSFPMQRTAKFVTAAALAASPAVFAAEPAAAQVESPVIYEGDFLVPSNGTVPLELSTIFEKQFGNDAFAFHDYQISADDGTAAEFEVVGDYLLLAKGKSGGTATVTITGKYGDESDPYEMTLNFRVLGSDADGKVSVADIVSLVNEDPDAYTKDEVGHLLAQAAPANYGPFPANLLPLRPVPFGPLGAEFDLHEEFIDIDGDIIGFELTDSYPGGLLESLAEGGMQDFGDGESPQYFSLDGHLLKVVVPYDAFEQVPSPLGTVVKVTDNAGAEFYLPFSFVPYSRYTIHYPDWPQIFYQMFELGEDGEVTAVTFSEHAPPGLDWEYENGYLHVRTVSEVEIKEPFDITVTSKLMGRFPIEMTFTIVPNSPIQAKDGPHILPVSVGNGFPQYNLHDLFDDPDITLYGERYYLSIVGINQGELYVDDRYGAFFGVDDNGILSFDMDGYISTYGVPPEDIYMYIEAFDNYENGEYNVLGIDFNTPPWPAHDGDLVVYTGELEEHGYELELFYNYDGYGMFDEYFDEYDDMSVESIEFPAGVKEALGIEIFELPTFGMTIYSAEFDPEKLPQEAMEFTVTATDSSGQEGALHVTLVPSREYEFYSDAAQTAYVDLDVIFEEPADKEYVYEIVSAPDVQGIPAVDIPQAGNILVINNGAYGSATIAAKSDGKLEKAVHLRMQPAMSEIVSYPADWTVTGDVYSTSVSPFDFFGYSEEFDYEYYVHVETDGVTASVEYEDFEGTLIPRVRLETPVAESLPQQVELTLLQVEISESGRKYSAETVIFYNNTQ